jgi:plastocyanin
MTDTPTDEREVVTEEGSEALLPAPRDGETVTTTEAEPVPFWQRPLVERFLVPLVLPIAVVVGLVAYVLNISRLFLSAHGHIPVIAGSIITAMILLGASLLSAASPRMRQSAITLVSAAFIFSIMSSGWLVLGHSQPEHTGPTTLSETLKTKQAIPVTAAPGGRLAFAPKNLQAKTGLATFAVTVAGAGHTFDMRDPSTMMASLSLDAAGTKKDTVAFFAKPGNYVFFCAIQGHETAGMWGTVTVTGPPMTLAEALAAAGNPPTAAAEG